MSPFGSDALNAELVQRGNVPRSKAFPAGRANSGRRAAIVLGHSWGTLIAVALALFRRSCPAWSSFRAVNSDVGRQPERLHRELPQSEYTTLQGRGHMVHHLDPDALAGAIDRAAQRTRM